MFSFICFAMSEIKLPTRFNSSLSGTQLYAEALAGPFAPFGVPMRNPFLNLRGMSFNDRILPVPVVFLLLAFSPQLTIVHVSILLGFVHDNEVG